MEDPRPERSRYLYYCLGIFCALNFLDQADRWALPTLQSAGLQCASCGTPDLSFHDRCREMCLHISDFEMGLLVGPSFSFTTLLLSFPAGWMADRYNRIYILWAGLLIWSCSTILSAFTHHFWELFLLRILLGVGQCVVYPCCFSMISDLFYKNRSLYLSFFTSMIYVGQTFGFSSAAISYASSWRVSFICLGIPGILLSFPLILTVRQPERGWSEKVFRASLAQNSGDTTVGELTDEKESIDVIHEMDLLSLKTVNSEGKEEMVVPSTPSPLIKEEEDGEGREGRREGEKEEEQVEGWLKGESQRDENSLPPSPSPSQQESSMTDAITSSGEDPGMVNLSPTGEDRTSDSWNGPQEVEDILSNTPDLSPEPTRSGFADIVSILKYPPFLALWFSIFFRLAGAYAVAGWAQVFYKRVHNIQIEGPVVLALMILPAAGALSSYVGSWLGDRVAARARSFQSGKAIICATSSLLSGLLFFVILLVPSPYLSFLFLAISLLLTEMWFPIAASTALDINPPHLRSLATSVFLSAAALASIGTLIVGWLNELLDQQMDIDSEYGADSDDKRDIVYDPTLALLLTFPTLSALSTIGFFVSAYLLDSYHTTTLRRIRDADKQDEDQ